jgi:hypothetical protein
LWSCGVILYFLLCGRPPFAPPDDELGRKKRKRNGVDLNELTARVLKGDYALDFGPWPRASAAVLDLVKGLMRVDARARLTAARALEHAWITRDGVAAEVPAPLGAAALTSLARYARATFFHKRVYNALAETLTMGELDSLRKEFAALDVDGDGFVTCGDLTALLAHLELAGAPLRGAALEVEAIVEACDLEDDHRISYHAFVVASMHRSGQDKGDSTSLQRECSARAGSGTSIHASRALRGMIARPKISRNEWKPAEIGAFEVGNFAPLSCPGTGARTSARTASTRCSTSSSTASTPRARRRSRPSPCRATASTPRSSRTSSRPRR